jgi:hypothetical protein
VKNLVLYEGVAPFLRGNNHTKKGATWVLKDEILHCVQNDKMGVGRCYCYTVGFATALALEHI